MKFTLLPIAGNTPEGNFLSGRDQVALANTLHSENGMIRGMLGPAIIARTIESHRYVDTFGNVWQYHSRSDHHGKVSCWAVLFDLLLSCELLRRHVANGTVCFGINHPMSDFRQDRRKVLDLVVCTKGTGRAKKRAPKTFVSLAVKYEIVLTNEERSLLLSLPEFESGPVGSVHLALEAKATMTAHQKAHPRLYDELTSSHVCIHGNSSRVIAVGLSMINSANEFISPDLNKRPIKDDATVSTHKADIAATTIEKIKQVARRVHEQEIGYDAFGVLTLDMRNDLTSVRVVKQPPALPPDDIFHYDAMIRRVAQFYEARFAHA